MTGVANPIPSHPRLPMATRAHRPARALVLVTVALIGLVLVEQIGGLVDVTRRPVLGADYQSAAAYVAARHAPGQPVVIALPPPGYLALGERDDLVFLASSLEDLRAQRYTRLTVDGRYVDFWLGVPAIVSAEELCAALDTSPDLWLIVDETRLNSDWAFAGSMANAIFGSTHEVFSGTGGVSVRRPNAEQLGQPTFGLPCHMEDASNKTVVG